MLGEHSYKYLTVDEMKSLGDDSMPIDVTADEKHNTLTKTSAAVSSAAAPSSIEAKLREMEKEQQQQKGHYELNEKLFAPDNVDLPAKQAVSLG